MNSLIRALAGGGRESMDKATGMQANVYKPRTFREQVQDQIAEHKAHIDRLQAVLDSMSPDVEKFVEAIQKANL